MTFKEIAENRKEIQDEVNDLRKMVHKFVGGNQPSDPQIGKINNKAVQFIYKRIIELVAELDKIDNIKISK